MAIENTDSKKNIRNEVLARLFLQADSYFKEHKYADSINVYTMIITMDPLNIIAWDRKSEAQVLCLKYEEAVNSCTKALEVKPSDPKAWFRQSFAYSMLGKYPEALASIIKCTELDPQYPMAWYMRGQFLYTLGKLEDALECFGNALKINPDNEHFQEVTDKIKRWLLRDGQNEESINKVMAFLKEGGHQEALQTYSGALKVDPRSVSKPLEKNFALAHLENPEQMLKDLEKTQTKEQPKITIEFSQKDLEFGRESWVEVFIHNKGATVARDLDLRFPPEIKIKYIDVTPEMVQKMKENKEVNLDIIPELTPGNMTKKLISMTPTKVGHTPLDIQVKYTDKWGKSQSQSSVVWISAFKQNEQLPAIPGYKTLWRLTTGDASNIYIAQRATDSLRVVVKIPVLHKEQVSLSSEFLNEIKQWSKLTHPHIVKILQYGDSPSPWIVMDYMAKGTLTKRISKLSIKESLEIASKIADALSYARTLHITHRNINPDNILFDNKDVPKITNWRIGNVMQKLHKDNTKLDTVTSYTPPEKLDTSLGGIDWQSDIYQLGVLLYEMLTGKQPFVSKSEELVQHILTLSPETPSKINMDINKSIDSIIMRCLSKNKKDRYSNISSLKTDLEKSITK